MPLSLHPSPTTICSADDPHKHCFFSFFKVWKTDWEQNSNPVMLSKLIFILASSCSGISPMSSLFISGMHTSHLWMPSAGHLLLLWCCHSFLEPCYISLLFQIRFKCCCSVKSLKSDSMDLSLPQIDLYLLKCLICLIRL